MPKGKHSVLSKCNDNEVLDLGARCRSIQIFAIRVMPSSMEPVGLSAGTTVDPVAKSQLGVTTYTADLGLQV